MTVPHPSCCLLTSGIVDVPFYNDSSRCLRKYKSALSPDDSVEKDLPGPLVVNMMSVISTTPCELVSPTRTTGTGLLMSLNADPPPIITDHASPTI